MSRLNNRISKIENRLKADNKGMTDKEAREFIEHQRKELRRYLYEGVPFSEIDWLEDVADKRINQAVFKELTTKELRELAGLEP